MKKAMCLVLLSLVAGLSAKADIVCTDGNTKVVISNNRHQATVSGNLLDQPEVFRLVEKHGILTAPGFAFFVNNQYGCLRNATLITPLQYPQGDDPSDSGYVNVVHMAACSGGSTPDRVCGL